MPADPYQTLGVTKDASPQEIEKAIGGWQKTPPKSDSGTKRAEEQFKEVSAAYDLLSDAQKRARFDRGEIDASGAERPVNDTTAISPTTVHPTRTQAMPDLPTSPAATISFRKFSVGKRAAISAGRAGRALSPGA